MAFHYAKLVSKPLFNFTGGAIRAIPNATITLYRAGNSTPAVIYSDENFTTLRSDGKVTTNARGEWAAYLDPTYDYTINYKGSNYETFEVDANNLESEYDIDDLKAQIGVSPSDISALASRDYVTQQIGILESATLTPDQVNSLIDQKLSSFSTTGSVAPPDLSPFARIRGTTKDIYTGADVPSGTTLAQWVTALSYVDSLGRVWQRNGVTAQAPDTTQQTPASADQSNWLSLSSQHYAKTYVDPSGRPKNVSNQITIVDLAGAFEELIIARDRVNFDLVFNWAQTNFKRTSQTNAKDLYGTTYDVASTTVTSWNVNAPQMLNIFGALFRAWNLWGGNDYVTAASKIISDLDNYCTVTDETRRYLNQTVNLVTNGDHAGSSSGTVFGVCLGDINPMHWRAAKTFTGSTNFDAHLTGYFDLVNKATATSGTFSSSQGIAPEWVSYNTASHAVGPITSGTDGWTITRSQNFTDNAQQIAAYLALDKLLFNETRGSTALTQLKTFYTAKWAANSAIANIYDRAGGVVDSTQSTHTYFNVLRVLTLGDSGNTTATSIRSAKLPDTLGSDSNGMWIPDTLKGITSTTSLSTDWLAWKGFAQDTGLWSDLTKLGASPSVGTLYAPGNTTGTTTPPVVVTGGSTNAGGTGTTTTPVGTKSLYFDPTSDNIPYTWATTQTGVVGTRAMAAFKNTPIAHWIAPSPGTLTTTLNNAKTYVDRAAAAGKTAVLVAYYIAGRDMGGASSGGAANLTDYQNNFIVPLADTVIGNRDVVLILEPDCLVEIPNRSADQQAGYFSTLAWTIERLKTRPKCDVRIDAGHSGWRDAASTADLLKKAHAENADGFACNDSNFRALSEIVPWAQQVRSLCGFSSNWGFIVDTSRNGNPTSPPSWQWDAPPEIWLGRSPQFGNTGVEGCDAFLWVKPPGEVDSPGSWSSALQEAEPAFGTMWARQAYNDRAGDNQHESGFLQLGQFAGTSATTTTTTPTPITGGGGNVGATTTSWYANGTQPSTTLSSVVSIFNSKYSSWKSTYLSQTGMPSGMTTGAYRVVVPDAGSANGNLNGTFSEGIGYGAIISAYASRSGSPIYDAAAQAIFDGLWKYYKYFRNSNGLMNWRIDSSGNIVGTGGATDADQDMCLGLYIMHNLHGDSGSVNYGAECKTLANSILTKEYDSARIMTNGDQWGLSADRYMPDYFHPAFNKEMAVFTGNNGWADVVQVNYGRSVDYFFNAYLTGYVPNECNRNSGTLGFGYTYGYNAIRMPFRLALDYLWNNDNRAQRNLNRMSTYVRGYTGGDPTLARAEGNLDGSNKAAYINKAFLSGFGLAGVADTGSATWQSSVITWLNNETEGTNYFGDNLRLIALGIQTGEWKPYR